MPEEQGTPPSNTPLGSTYILNMVDFAKSDWNQGTCAYSAGSSVILAEHSIVREGAWATNRCRDMNKICNEVAREPAKVIEKTIRYISTLKDSYRFRT